MLITNDGATILRSMSVQHPAARMVRSSTAKKKNPHALPYSQLVEMSEAQDIEAGDGTTSVVVLTGSLLRACQELLEKGIKPAQIASGFHYASHKAVEYLQQISIPLDLTDREQLLKIATTSLNSKVVSQYSQVLGPIAVNAVLGIVDPANDRSVDLRDIKIVKKVGGTIDDTEMANGLVLTQNVSSSAGGPTRMEKARVALIQFQISPPKSDVRAPF